MQSIELTKNGASVEMRLNVSVFTFWDVSGGCYISYCPSLDLMGYDTTQGGAMQSLSVVIKEYLDYCTTENTLQQDLRNHGWTDNQEPTLAQLLEASEQLRSITTADFTKTSLTLGSSVLNEHAEAKQHSAC